MGANELRPDVPEYGIALADQYGQWVGPTRCISADNEGDAVRQATSLVVEGLNLEVWDREFKRLIGRLPD
jgi:hypothetical protein